MCYYIIKEAIATGWLTKLKGNKTLPDRSKYREGFVILATDQINERQQSEEEFSKRHQVFEIKTILHMHHLHSM